MGAERDLPAGSPHIVSAVPPTTGPADGYMRVTRAVTSGSKYVKLDCGGSAAAARISEGTSAPAQAARSPLSETQTSAACHAETFVDEEEG